MGTAEAVMLGLKVFLALLNVVMEIVKSKETGVAPQLGPSVVEVLGGIGKVGKIKELNTVDLTSIVPDLDEIGVKIHDLIERRRAGEAKPAS